MEYDTNAVVNGDVNNSTTAPAQLEEADIKEATAEGDWKLLEENQKEKETNKNNDDEENVIDVADDEAGSSDNPVEPEVEQTDEQPEAVDGGNENDINDETGADPDQPITSLEPEPEGGEEVNEKPTVDNENGIVGENEIDQSSITGEPDNDSPATTENNEDETNAGEEVSAENEEEAEADNGLKLNGNNDDLVEPSDEADDDNDEQARDELEVVAAVETIPDPEESNEKNEEQEVENENAETEINEAEMNGAATDTDANENGLGTSASAEDIKENQSEDFMQPETVTAINNQPETTETVVTAPSQKSKMKPGPLKKKAPPKITIPLPFKLYQPRSKVDTAEKETPPLYRFKANPVPKKVLAGPRGLKTKSNPNLKVMENPEPLKSNADVEEQGDKKEENQNAEPSDGSTKSSPKTSKSYLKALKPFTAKKTSPTSVLTKIKPFSFAERDIELQRKKEMKIKEQKLEQEMNTFKFEAKPVPSFRAKPIIKKTTSTPAAPVATENGGDK